MTVTGVVPGGVVVRWLLLREEVLLRDVVIEQGVVHRETVLQEE